MERPDSQPHRKAAHRALKILWWEHSPIPVKSHRSFAGCSFILLCFLHILTHFVRLAVKEPGLKLQTHLFSWFFLVSVCTVPFCWYFQGWPVIGEQVCTRRLSSYCLCMRQHLLLLFFSENKPSSESLCGLPSLLDRKQQAVNFTH